MPYSPLYIESFLMGLNIEDADAILQTILCSADNTLEKAEKNGLIDGNADKRQCRNAAPLYELLSKCRVEHQEEDS
jgi:hypothetical protein